MLFKSLKIESIIFIFLLIVLATISIYTLSWYQEVWVDEVSYSDPSVNLIMGRGFTSTTWPSQPSSEFWASNAPLHQYLLVPWLKIFGVSLKSVRSINILYLVLASIVLWKWMDKTEFIKDGLAKILLISSLWLCGIMSHIYRNGRPDSIMLLIAVVLLYLFFYEGKNKRLYTSIAGALSVAAGIQLPPFVLLVCGCAFIIFEQRKLILQYSISYVIGVLSGLVLLLVFLQMHNSAYTFLTQTFASGYTITGDAAQIAVYTDNTAYSRLLTRLAQLFEFKYLYLRDTSFTVLFVYLCLTTIFFLVKKDKVYNKVYWFLLVYLFIPPAILLLGRYPVYYSWMGYLILLIGTGITIQQSRLRIIHFAGLSALLISCIAGLSASFFEQKKNGKNNQHIITDFVKQNISSSDYVLGSDIVYYPCKKYAGGYYSLSYSGGRGLPKFPEVEKIKITKLLVDSNDYTIAIKKIGGNWKKVSSIPSLSLNLYIRTVPFESQKSISPHYF